MRLAVAITVGTVFSNVGAPAIAACTVPPATDNGLSLQITSVKYVRSPALQALVVTIVATNGTGATLAIKSAQWGENAQPSSSTGLQFFTAVARGIATTQGAAAPTCLSNPGCSEDSASYTILPPRGAVRFTYAFGSMMPPKAADDITFPVILVTRFAGAAPQALRFQFNAVAAGCS